MPERRRVGIVAARINAELVVFHRHRAVGVGTRLAPFEIEAVRLAAERLGVQHRQLLREEVDFILAGDDAPLVILGHDFENVHVDRVASRHAHRDIGRIVFDQRDVIRAAHRRQRIMVDRRVDHADFATRDCGRARTHRAPG